MPDVLSTAMHSQHLPSTPASRTVGFLTSDTDPGYYGTLLAVLREVCSPLDIRLVVFEGRALHATALAPMCYNAIYHAVGGQRLDGLLVASSGMGAVCGPARLDEFLSTLRLPTVTIGMPLASYSGVDVDDASAVRLVLDHLVSHGRRRIAYASGPAHIVHSRERLEAYRQWIAETGTGLGLREDIHLGNFTARNGYEIMERLHGRVGESLDAVCFANDYMALGALEYCNTHGIRIPDDLAIIGIDGIELSGLVTPGLSSAAQNIHRMAQIAVDELVRAMDAVVATLLPAFSPPHHQVVPFRLINRRSCGCSTRAVPGRNVVLQDIMNRSLYIGESVQTFRSADLYERMEYFLRRKSISLCFVVIFADNPKGVKCQSFSLPPASRVLLGYANGKRYAHDEPFPTRELLPGALWRLTAGLDLILKPLFFESEVFGFLIAASDDRERAHIDDLRLMISVTLKGESLIEELQQAHRQVEWALDSMRTVNRQLSDISLRDELTGLYNRRGFMQEAGFYLGTRPESFLLGFADMNGLKDINDNYGHEAGDQALQTIADILRHCCREGDILARVSGDEFAFLVRDAGEKHREMLEARFEERLALYNAGSGQPREVSFARGYAIGNADTGLEDLLRIADVRMYEHKARQKQAD